MTDDLSGFDIKADSTPAPDVLSQEFERFFHNYLPYLYPAQAAQIIAKIHALEIIPVGQDRVVYGADYDIAAEIQQLLQAVRAMQGSVMSEDGRILQGITPREMKEVVTASSSLMSLLMKSHEKLMTFDRHRALEQATVQILQDLSDEVGGEKVVSRFVELMEQRLESK